jgi:hypothetical protein
MSMKNSNDTMGLEPVTSRLAAQCLKQLHNRVPHGIVIILYRNFHLILSYIFMHSAVEKSAQNLTVPVYTLQLCYCREGFRPSFDFLSCDLQLDICFYYLHIFCILMVPSL